MALIPDAIGWLATGIFAASYFAGSQDKLCLVQAFAALFWLAYGVVIRAPPVIAANLIVAGLALFTFVRSRRGTRARPRRSLVRTAP